MLRTVDTDVLVLAIAFAGILQEQQVQQVEVWVAMGTGSHFRYIAAHEISNNLGLGMSKVLLVFHAFTGCDTVSCFAERQEDCIHSLEELPSRHRYHPTACSYTY